ncbi:MAG: hydroxyacid dehydrogenase [bacterium]|nr:hydroxyacid dehydrogenase [bacterium]
MNILILGGIAALGADVIRSQLTCECHMDVIADASETLHHTELIERADVIVGWPLTRAIVSAAVNVKLIHVAGAGVDGIPFDLLGEDVIVANTFHHETSIAEHVLMMVLVLKRRPAEYDRRLRDGNWWDSCIWGGEPNLGVIEGTTALLIGTGHIAREVAQRARPFGVKTVAVSRDPSRAPAEIDETVGYDVWRDRLGEADFVVPACPLTGETEGMLAAAEFERMKPSAYVINTARGKVVDERALYEALRDRKIGGAAIDVWYQYPAKPEERMLPSQYRFHELDNVVMTPHVSAWTHRTVDGRMRDIAENINRLAEGRGLINVVHPRSE